MKRFKSSLLLAAINGIVILVVLSLKAYGGEIGRIGPTYPIAEMPISQRVKDIMKNENLKPTVPPKFELPKVKEASTRMLDLSFTLPYDIKDKDGHVFFEKGFQMNPLKYQNIRTLIAIDADDPTQVRWFESSPFGSDPLVRILITGGDKEEISKRFGVSVFRLNDPVAKRFTIEKVPTILRQKGDLLEISEVVPQ